VLEPLEDRTVPSSSPLLDPTLAEMGKLFQPAVEGAQPVAAATSAHEFVFVDPAVQDAGVLMRGINPDATVVRLSPDADGVHQIAAALDGQMGVSAIHILSHGEEGMLRLGSTTLTSDNIDSYVMDWGMIRNALTPGADLLLYGCDVAEGTAGAAFVNRLAKATGADVAASTNPTGAAVMGGDWLLEYSTGPIQTPEAFSQQAEMLYPDLLNVTVTAATGGTNLSADRAANATAPQWTTLANIVITEPGNGKQDIGPNQTNATLILTAPTGWAFNPGQGSVTFQSGKDITAATMTSVTSSVATINFSTGGGINVDALTISGLQVRATDGSVLPATGRIYRAAGNAGTATITGIVSGSNADGSGTGVTDFGDLSQVAGAASKPAFTTGAQTLTAGVTSNLMTIQLRDQFGTAVNWNGVQTVTLSTSSGSGVFRDAADTTTLTTIAPPLGSSNFSFRYKDTAAGTPTITISGSGLTSTSQIETVNPGAAEALAFTTGAQTLTAGVTSDLMTIQLRDHYGNAVNWNGVQTVNLNTSSGSGVFRDAGDTMPITNITPPVGSSSINFRYKDTAAGTPTITVAVAGLAFATQIETVNPGAAEVVAFTSSPQSLYAGDISAPITIQLRDHYGNTVNWHGVQTVNLSSTSSSGVFRNAGDTGTITSITPPLGVPGEIVVAFVAKLTLYGFWPADGLFAELLRILENRGDTLPNSQRISGHILAV
jgi:hypothetical protein